MIFAVWRMSRFKFYIGEYFQKRTRPLHSRLDTQRSQLRKLVRDIGLIEGAIRKAAIAEKMADRAFNMASSANLGVIALQKALAVPRLLTKEQGQRNELAKQNIDALFSGGDALDFLKPIATEEELLAIEKIQEDKRKQMLNGNKNT